MRFIPKIICFLALITFLFVQFDLVYFHTQDLGERQNIRNIIKEPHKSQHYYHDTAGTECDKCKFYKPSSSSKSEIPTKSSSRSAEPKIILFATKWWFKHYPFLKEAGDLCPKCLFTEDKRLFKASHAVVFFAMRLTKGPPKNLRPPNQIWVWLHLEPPITDKDKKNKAFIDYLYKFVYLNVFNWTMTYRKDSDIYVPYGEIVPNAVLRRPSFDEAWAFMPSDVGLNNNKQQEIYKESMMIPPTIEELKGRRMVAWIVTHCDTQSKREAIAKGLQKYVDVDIYGSCGTHSCEFNKSGMSTSGNPGIDCRIEISKKYKFYLALENSICEDYVTEKYFDTYFTQMIPIVYGGVDYSRLAPNSYINVMDFKSMAKLAAHLKYLDQNPKEFLKYFDWKMDYWVKNNGYITGWCNLCDKLWTDSATDQVQVYGNVHDWWKRRSDFKESGRNSCRSEQEINSFIDGFVM